MTQPLPPDQAEVFAAQVLGWIAGEDDRMMQFLAATGADLPGIHAQARDPAFLASVIDFLMMDEAALIACCEALDTPPDMPMRARAGLPGGDLPHWT